MSKFFVTAFLSAVSAALGFSFLSSTAHAQYGLEQSNWQSMVAWVFGVRPEALAAVPGGPFLLIIFIALIYVLFFAAIEVSPLKRHAKAIALLLALTVIPIGTVVGVWAWMMSWAVLVLGAFALVVVLIFIIFAFYRKMIPKRMKSTAAMAAKIETGEIKEIEKEKSSVLEMMQQLKAKEEEYRAKREALRAIPVNAVKKGKPLSDEEQEKIATEVNRLTEQMDKIHDQMLLLSSEGRKLKKEELERIISLND